MAGTSQSITIEAYDEFNNLATGYDGSKLMRFSGADASPAPSTEPTVSSTDFGLNTEVSFDEGVATVDMALYLAETAVIVATEITDGTAGASDGAVGSYNT